MFVILCKASVLAFSLETIVMQCFKLYIMVKVLKLHSA